MKNKSEMKPISHRDTETRRVGDVAGNISFRMVFLRVDLSAFKGMRLRSFSDYQRLSAAISGLNPFFKNLTT